jgi:hypothetical protein
VCRLVRSPARPRLCCGIAAHTAARLPAGAVCARRASAPSQPLSLCGCRAAVARAKRRGARAAPRRTRLSCVFMALAPPRHSVLRRRCAIAQAAALTDFCICRMLRLCARVGRNFAARRCTVLHVPAPRLWSRCFCSTEQTTMRKTLCAARPRPPQRTAPAACFAAPCALRSGRGFGCHVWPIPGRMRCCIVRCCCRCRVAWPHAPV